MNAEIEQLTVDRIEWLRLSKAETGLPDTDRLRMRPILIDDVDNLLLIFADPVAMEFWPALKTREEIGRSVEWRQLR